MERRRFRGLLALLLALILLCGCDRKTPEPDEGTKDPGVSEPSPDSAEPFSPNPEEIRRLVTEASDGLSNAQQWVPFNEDPGAIAAMEEHLMEHWADYQSIWEGGQYDLMAYSLPETDTCVFQFYAKDRFQFASFLYTPEEGVQRKEENPLAWPWVQEDTWAVVLPHRGGDATIDSIYYDICRNQRERDRYVSYFLRSMREIGAYIDANYSDEQIARMARGNCDYSTLDDYGVYIEITDLSSPIFELAFLYWPATGVVEVPVAVNWE